MTYSIETDLRANFSSSQLKNEDGSFVDPGFVQQTFLGASIIDFSISAGFGDSSSTMSINLVNDEFNNSDMLGIIIYNLIAGVKPFDGADIEEAIIC